MTDAWRKRPWSKTVSNLPTLVPKRPFTWAERYSTSSASAPLISANCLGESSYYLADWLYKHLSWKIGLNLPCSPSLHVPREQWSPSSDKQPTDCSLPSTWNHENNLKRIFQVGFTCKPPPYGERCGLSHCPLYQLETRMRKGLNI